MRIVALPLLLAGCATMGAAPDEPYSALGTEPFWSISVANGRISYDSPEERFSVPLARSRETGDGRIYESRRITLHAWNAECSDGMSDNRYPQTVRAVVDGRVLDGCGGGALPPAALAGTSWSIVSIGGEDVFGADYHLQFEDGRLSGRAGCNRFSGPYSADGGRLTAGPLAATRMACPEPRMRHERTVMEILAATPAITHPDGTILLLSADGAILRLRRAI